MKENDLRVAEQLKRMLAEIVPIVDFRVFGSRARGDADPDSDMDVFLEVESLNKALKERISDIAWEVGFENRMVISLLILTRDEIENSALRSSPIVTGIAEEGVRI
jgi:predicted nucleotidyltransferase